MRSLILLGLSGCTILTEAFDPICGDGFIQEEKGELCDDGNDDNTDDCPGSCRPAVCGDGFVQTGAEGCDDGNLINTDACLNACQPATCGDGFQQLGVEACDDGNTISGDGCRGDCLVLEGCGDGVIDPPELCFSDGVPVASEKFPAEVASGDLNGDNNLDLALITNSTNDQPNGTLQLFLGNGDGTFQPPSSIIAGAGFDAGGIVIADLDNDNDTDIATIFNDPANTNLAQLVTFLQGSGGALISQPTFAGFGVNATALALIDDITNADGLPELVTSLFDTGAVQLLNSITALPGVFSAGVTLPDSNGPADVLVANLIGDAGLDIAALNQTSGTIDIFLRESATGISASPVKIVSLGATPNAFVAADLNADGRLDFGVIFSDSTLRTFLQQQDESFLQGVNVPVSNPSAIAALDLDADSDQDLVVANKGTAGTISLFVNDGASFSPAGIFSAGEQPSSIAVGDFNEDGVGDLAVTSLFSAQLFLFLSNP